MASQNGSIDGKELATAAARTGRPDPEVPERLERARRRQFTVGYKQRTHAGSVRDRCAGAAIAAALVERDQLLGRVVSAEWPAGICSAEQHEHAVSARLDQRDRAGAARLTGIVRRAIPVAVNGRVDTDALPFGP